MRCIDACPSRVNTKFRSNRPCSLFHLGPDILGRAAFLAAGDSGHKEDEAKREERASLGSPPSQLQARSETPGNAFPLLPIFCLILL